jgi:hypothetical protein
VGGADELAAIADDIGVSFESNLSASVAQTLLAVPDKLDHAPEEPAPLNWSVRSFDFKSCSWVDELLPNSACEFTPTYGHSKYYVHRKRGRLLKMPKRDALYAAAMLNGVRLAQYEQASRLLTVPLFAPLPELYSRAACLCSGRPATVDNKTITYKEVPPDLSAILMVAAGQPHCAS